MCVCVYVRMRMLCIPYMNASTAFINGVVCIHMIIMRVCRICQFLVEFPYIAPGVPSDNAVPCQTSHLSHKDTSKDHPTPLVNTVAEPNR